MMDATYQVSCKYVAGSGEEDFCGALRKGGSPYHKDGLFFTKERRIVVKRAKILKPGVLVMNLPVFTKSLTKRAQWNSSLAETFSHEREAAYIKTKFEQIRCDE